MVTRVGFTACCTASIVYDFGHHENLRDGAERLLIQAIDTSRKARQALVVATTTAQQTAGESLLAKHGFKKVMDVADVKYAGTSKRLRLWALDLNEKATEALNVAAPVNPFAAAALIPPAAPPVHVVLPTAPPRVQARPGIRDQRGHFIGVGRSFQHDFERPLPQSWAGRDDLRFTLNVPAFAGDRARTVTELSPRRIGQWRRSPEVPTSIRTLTRTA